MVYQVTNFYQFVSLDEGEIADLCQTWENAASALHLTGTILVAAEGVNAALAGEPDAVAAFLAHARTDPRFAGIKPHVTSGATPPFRWLEVKHKPWIIRFSEAGDPSVPAVLNGGRIAPAALKALLDLPNPDVVMVDTRNDYETEAGRFAGAVCLNVKSFTEFPAAFTTAFSDRKDQEFVFYCTGGIRCEKAVAWAAEQGYRARQLDGGILGYLRENGAAHFDGECFVFDGRRAIDGSLKEPASRAPAEAQKCRDAERPA